MNSFKRRLGATVVALMAALAGVGAGAQSTDRPIRLVVPFGPGGVADLTARVVAQKMTENTRQAIVVDNKPGAGGIVAADTVAKAAPDGLTLLLMSNGNAVTAGLFEKLPFDPVRSFAPVSMLGSFDMAVIASPKSRFRTLAALIAHARANPGKVNIATINTGSTQNLAAELFRRSLGIDVQIVPFNGSAAVVTALQGEQVDAAVEILAPVLGQVTGRTLLALAVMGEKRSSALPDVPTVAESGAPGFNVASWNAFAAPAGTPADVIARLNKATREALDSPDVQARLAKLGVQGKGSSPEAQGEFYAREIRRWSDVIRQAGIPRQ
ncbi:MAG: tripartite tricarboxylate transporter substrate binding protein [Variovorax sp.]|nr:MAG: tripartite tricarboxylate transporter substrate binding protein [Variovorax sp.]